MPTGIEHKASQGIDTCVLFWLFDFLNVTSFTPIWELVVYQRYEAQNLDGDTNSTSGTWLNLRLFIYF